MEGQKLTIIKKVKKGGGAGHHGGSWKVAFADFMTAMMAFFLIMWLINVTDENVRKGIAQYFNPIHMSQGSTQLKGLSATPPKGKPAPGGHGDAPLPEANLNLINLTGSKAAGKPISPEAAAAALNAAAELAAKMATGTSALKAEKPKPADSGQSTADALKTISAVAAELKPPNGGYDREAFQDPYAVLAKLEKAYVATQPTSVDVVTGDPRAEGAPGGEVERDPFDPSYWQMVPLANARTSKAGKPGTAGAVPSAGKPDAAASPGGAATEAVAAAANAPAQPATIGESGASTPAAPNAPQAGTAATEQRSAEIAREIKKSVASMMADKASPGLTVAATKEGVTINLADDANYAMFPIGSAVPVPKTVVLLERIAKVLERQRGDIVISGHTDGRPFHSADYDNWRLSAARAEMAYYTLLRGGLDQKRVVAIEGHADRALKNPHDPYAAENRRIEILVRNSP